MSAEIGTPSVAIERFDVDGAAAVLPQLKAVLDGAYYDSHMYRDLAEDLDHRPETFQLFVALAEEQEQGTAVGVAVVESKVHEAFDYLGLPPVHLKRFTVLEAFRKMHIGKRLLDASKRYAFDELGLQAMFVESNEIGAIAMYGREGALYNKESIYEYYRRNAPEQALAYFHKAITDPSRRGERYPNGEGIRFVFARDEETARFLREHGYMSKGELAAVAQQKP